MSVELINTDQSRTDEENIFSNTEAELALIGCILWDNRNYEKVSDFINENQFVDQADRKSTRQNSVTRGSRMPSSA